jgi:hypothetical protein
MWAVISHGLDAAREVARAGPGTVIVALQARSEV